MKKRILSILLTLCMMLMLCPVTAFAETPSEKYSLTLNFKYGTLRGQTGSYLLRSDCKAGDKYDIKDELYDLTGYEPYKIVDCRSAEGDGVTGTFTDHNIVLEVVYQLQGSLAITVEGFQVGNTPADCTVTFDSTIPGVTFSEDDIQSVSWAEFVFDGSDYVWSHVSNTDVFEADTRYQVAIYLDNKGLNTAPAVTVNGKTPEFCGIATRNGVPFQLQITCTFGTPPMPPLTIDGPDVVCAQQDYEFTVTPPAGVTLNEPFRYENDDASGYTELTIDEDGVGHGVVPASEYGSADSIELAVFGEAADGTSLTVTKSVQILKEHRFVDGVCGCGAKQQYIVEYIGSGDDPSCVDFKTHGEALTLRGKTFTMDGFVQTGWVDGQGAIYELGSAYTENRDVTLYPVFEKLVTVTAPFTMTVEQGGNTAPGKTDFELVLIDGSGNELTYEDEYFVAVVNTDGAGDYDGSLTITAPLSWFKDMIYEGAFIWQYDGEEEGWTYDDTVWGVRLYMPEVAARSVSEPEYSLLIYPTYVMDNGLFNLDLDAGPVDEMTFTNTYTKNTTLPEDEEPTEIPNTGDSSNLALWFALLAVSAAGVIGMVVYSRRKGNCKTK